MRDLLIGSGYVLIYFAVLATLAILLRCLVKVPDEVFRKLLHFILLGSLPVFVYGFPTWQGAAGASLGFAVLVYPLLCLGERWKGYSALLTERKTGEIKNSLLLVFGMFTLVIGVCWGWLQDRLLVLTCVYAWGFGDAFAAIVGKKRGRHKITGAHLSGKKSYEGTLAMLVVSYFSVSFLLHARGGLPWFGYDIVSLLTAAAVTLVELYTLDGKDTLYCPVTAMAVLLPLLAIFGGFA